ncbi:substrate-binding domain-containing protein [Candidatus Auribacterota bacterium]
MSTSRIMQFLLPLLLVSLIATPFAKSEVIIIASNDVSINKLDRSTIANIYLGKKTKWENGMRIRVVMLKKGATHESFSHNIVQKTPARISTIWKKAIFTGTGTPPKILKTASEIVAYIQKTPGAISYIDAGSAHEGVKIITLKEQ